MTDTDCDPQTEMPKYRSHKEVWALQIKSMRPPPELTANGLTITPAEEGYAPFRVDQAYVDKHNPHCGGYYVVYKDGYKSFSPAEAFEEGYTPLDISEAEAKAL